MIRSPLFACAILAVLLVSGCDKDAQEQQEKAVKAQAEANLKASEARSESDKKAATAQAEATKKIAEAQAGFNKLVEDYRHKATTDLADLDKKIEAIDARALKETGKAKTDLQAKLTQIRASREAYVADLKGLESGQASTWDLARARNEVKWGDLKKLVESA